MKAARAAVCSVWLYEGLWCKILAASPDQRAIVAGLPGLPAGWATAALAVIGAVEGVLGVWVLTGMRVRSAAAVQTVLLVAFNTGGLLFGAAHIAEPGRMLTQNAALLALVWLLAKEPKHG